MGRGILLWLLGIPIPVIILLYLFHPSDDHELGSIPPAANRAARGTVARPDCWQRCLQ